MLLDFALSGSSSDQQNERLRPMLNFTTDFLRPAPLGAWLEVQVTVEQSDAAIVFSHCALIHSGLEIASARSISGATTRT